MPVFPLRRNNTAAVAEPEIALVVGRASWWIPEFQRKNSNIKKRKTTFAEALKDFLQHVSFHCYEKIVETGRRFAERLLWLIVHITALTILIIFLSTFEVRNDQLLATSIYDPLYPIGKVAFPAVSICTVNRFSNASVMRYAEELNSKDPEKRGIRYFYERIHVLSYNYNADTTTTSYNHKSDNTNSDYEWAFEFQRFLDLYDTADNESFYNTRRRMKMLTPNCSDILLNCTLGGEKINCKDEFVDTLTSRGYCCTFNSNGKYSVERPFNMRLFGPEKGLVVLLNASTKDYYYNWRRLDGFMTFIFSTDNFPDVSSGGVTDRVLWKGIESYISIKPKVLETVNEVRFLRPKVRKCYFDDEMPRAFGKKYTFNKCITRCRVRSILILCNCLLFMYPYEYLDAATDTIYCTLQHKECLERYDFKWANVVTQRENIQGLEREMEDALYCPDCLPSCTETRYMISMMGLPLNAYSVRKFRKDIDGNATDLASLRIFFAEPEIQYFRQILKVSWYEGFSFIGNICSIITGFSLVGICEVLYFLCKQLFAALHNEVLLDRNRNRNRKDVITKEKLIILP